MTYAEQYAKDVAAMVDFYADEKRDGDRARALRQHRPLEDGSCAACRIHERPEYRRFATCMIAYTAGVADSRVAVKRRAQRAAAILAEHPTPSLPEESPSWPPTNSSSIVPDVEPDTAVS